MNSKVLIMKKSISVILVFFLTFPVFAQRSELGLFGGGSSYNGDLNPGSPFKVHRPPALGLFYRYNLDTRLAIKLGYTTGEIKNGNKDFSDYSDGGKISFHTSINELSAQFEINFYDFSIDGEENRISPYIFGGVGYTFFNSTTTYTGLTPPLQPDAEKNIKINSNTISFPFGVGIKFCPFRNVTTGFEWGIRKTTSDKLDGVYTDPYSVSAANDWYSFIGFWISYRINFFNSDRCYYY